MNFFQMPHFLWDREDLDVYERAVLTHIVRKTVGWGKAKDAISNKQFIKLLGISKRKIQYVTESLVKKKLIVKSTKIGALNSYQLHPQVIEDGNKVVHEICSGAQNAQGSAKGAQEGVQEMHPQNKLYTKKTITRKTLYQERDILKSFQTFKAHFIEKNTNTPFYTSGIGFLTSTQFKINENGHIVNLASDTLLSKEEAYKVWEYLYDYYKNQLKLKITMEK